MDKKLNNLFLKYTFLFLLKKMTYHATTIGNIDNFISKDCFINTPAMFVTGHNENGVLISAFTAPPKLMIDEYILSLHPDCCVLRYRNTIEVMPRDEDRLIMTYKCSPLHISH